ncbi:MAG TPA: site-2 protease family protein [Candidatus Saccharimonadales bacterium]|nr:site-2 protease family protein [Candidatus Saccharimonadales bacterium]
MISIILLVILIFGLLVFVHELGHFVAARRNGVEVEEFGFGFPPLLYGRQVGRTKYSINWIPLGGFVRLKGENLTDGTEGSFGAASFWAKTKILLAGVTMNALVAYLILVYLCLTGLPPLIDKQFAFGQASYAQPKQVMVVAVEPDSPADRNDIKRGDILLEADGQKLSSESDLLNFTKSHAGRSVTIDVDRHGQRRTIHTLLRPADSKQGFLGVTPLQTYKLKYGFVDSLIVSAGLLWQLIIGTLLAFGGLIAGLFIHGQVSDQVAGPVGIVVILSNIVNLGLAYVLTFVASISLSLAVINALPLPALDGGRWVMALAQAISGKTLSERVETAIHAAGFVALILLMVVVTAFDIARLN